MAESAVKQHSAGQEIARKYRLTRPLGEGAFGEVWLAERMGDGSPVVVKILHTQWARVPSVVERFRREALASTRVNHANVCRIFEYAMTDDEIPFIAMEYLSGGTLKQELARSGPMTVARVAEVMAPVCDAVGAAHQAGIIHRDLKPDNIMLTMRAGQPGQVTPVVLDFGIAKLLDATEKLTQTGSMMGTPAYMSPEQAQGKTDIGPGADVYALAIITFELLVGKPPFVARTLAEMAMKHVLEPAPKLASVPPALVDVIDKSLAKGAQDRPPADALAAALREAAAQAPNARATQIDTPDHLKLNPSGGGSSDASRSKSASSAGPAAKVAIDSHDAATVISMGGAEVEARAKELLATARSTGKMAAQGAQPPAKAPISPLLIAAALVGLAVIGALIGLLLKG